MATGKFELWLDESGNFSKENEKSGAPSIVGGILVPVKKDNDQWTADLVKKTRESYNIIEKYIHGTELRGTKYGEMAVSLLEESIEHGARLVVFENKERIDIVNSDMTYLNILSEGIIQLFQTLASEYEAIELSILAANRVKVAGMDERKETILLKHKEYKERLEEKIALGLARRTLVNQSNWKWTFQLDSAKNNPRLMIADVVCHSWFVQDGNKFTEETRNLLRKLYQPAFLFSVFEQATEGAIRRSLAAGLMGDALFHWLDAKASNAFSKQNQTEFDYPFYLQLIQKKLRDIPEFSQVTQLSTVENQLLTLISIDRDFDRAQQMLELLQDEVLPTFKENGINAKRFLFKVYMNLLEIANHRGNVILGTQQITKIRSILEQLAGRWETIDDVLDFMVLEGVHDMNNYDFHSAISVTNQMQKFIDTSLEFLSISLLEDLSIISDDMKSTIKGKVLGTRLQARMFLIRSDREQLELARHDSDQALEEFTAQSDVNRQYQYRSQIESEAGEPVSALEWLGKAFQVDYTTTDSIKEIITNIRDANYINSIFGSMHFWNALVSAFRSDSLELAEQMCQEWVKSGIEQSLLNEVLTEHPYEIISWKQAYYLAKTNRVKAAIEKYDQAIHICNYANDRYTLRSIGLGILCEKASVLFVSGKKYGQDLKKTLQFLRKNYQEFMSEPLPEEIRNYFKQWEDTFSNLDSLSEEEQSIALSKLSRSIPY
ncbi:hypothetical protein [Neobacillus sp. CF12]|uniref:hypothetical protein n=1 Tax=Neobacillus sp. CF12 TaxID=3055864 RepID=UPI0025A0C40D|nr:hypothetical protein [Neobacillus sp. CF12]MDM5326756.1 hypothetical protein [Neobacillus sp. CF12]